MEENRVGENLFRPFQPTNKDRRWNVARQDSFLRSASVYREVHMKTSKHDNGRKELTAIEIENPKPPISTIAVHFLHLRLRLQTQSMMGVKHE